MAKLSNLIGKIPAIDSYLSCSNAYKMKPKAYQLNETQEISVINQNHNGQQIASDKALLTKFWDWFDGSATVDDKGRPIVFYHGSPYKFDKFKTKHTFLSTSANFANDYAAAKSFEQGLDLAPNIYDCYLKIKNPLNIGSKTGINAVLTAVKGKSIEAYWRKISEWDLSVALEGKTPYNYLDNFDKAKVGEYINPRNRTSTSWMVSNDSYLIVHKTDNKIYAIRVKEYPLYAPYRGYENTPKNLDEVTLVSNNITSNMPKNALMHKPTNGVYISVPREEAQAINNQTRLENLGKAINVQKLNYNSEGEASIRIPFKIHGSFITGVDKFTDEQEIGGFFDVEAIIYTDKENAKLAEADDTWDLIETIQIDGEDFFDFLHQIGFDSIYIMENGVLNVCVFDNTDIKLTSDFRIQKDSSSEDYTDFLKTHKPLTEASKPVQANLINQNHLGKPIAKDEESLKRFWKWFGKSATVDQKGRPFVFYHGSAYTFSKFDAGQIIGQLEGDNAVFFSTSKKFAEEFGSDRVAYQDALEAGDEDAHEGSLNIPSDEDDYIDEEHLYECYLRVKNPFNPKNKNNVNLFIQWVRQNVPADVLSNYKIDFDLLKSSLSGTYPMNYTNDLNSLNLYDVIKISAYADSKPVETILRNQNPSDQIDKSLWKSGFHTYAQVFHKGKRSALAFSISIVDIKSLMELAKKYSKNGKFEINLKVSPAMVADRVMRSGVKFSDAVSKKVPASFPVEISWGTRVKKRELLTVPVNVVVWSITEKDNARTKSYDSIWEEMENLVIGEDYSFVGILKALGFDSFYTYEESYLILAVFDPENNKSTDNVGKWGRGKNIYESVLCERLIGDAGSAKLIA